MKKISVVIPTYNGANKLPVTLDALQNQTIRDFELILVNDGSTDNTLQFLESYPVKSSDLKIVNQANAGRAKARNEGVRASSGDIIIFIDDDIEVDARTIEFHSNFLQQNPRSILVGFPQLNFEKIKHDSFLRFRFDAEQAHRNRFPKGTFRVTLENYVFTTAVMSVNRKDFISLGMFDERLTDSEDFDFSLRALKKEFNIFCTTTLIAFHNDFAEVEAIVRRQLQYYRSKKALAVLHPDYEKLIPSHYTWIRQSYTDFVKKLFFSAKGAWFRIFQTTIFKSIPRKWQRKLYGLFIYTNSVLLAKRRQADEA